MARSKDAAGGVPLLQDEIHDQPQAIPPIQGLATQASAAPAAAPPASESESVYVVSALLDAARDPNVSVDKLERLIAMQERLLATEAKQAFDRAFARMQSELPVVVERGKTDKGKYARFEDIIPVLRPVLKKHGFGLSFQTQWPGEGTPPVPDKFIRVIGSLTHQDGHSRSSRFEANDDNSGSKNAVQARGSTVSYGRRYTTLDLLGIATGEDDDGVASGKAGQADRTPPKGYDQWLTDLQAVADNGMVALKATWRDEKSAPHREFLTRTDRALWQKIQQRASEADRRDS